MPKGTTFIAQVFYGSIGYSVGAALGAGLAAPQRPLVLIVGDGSFQMTAQEVSTMIRYKINPLIILINNDGYTIERAVSDNTYNDIQPWSYHQLPEVLGGKRGNDCKTEGDFEQALKKRNASELQFVEVHTDRWDMPPMLKAAGNAMRVANA